MTTYHKKGTRIKAFEFAIWASGLKRIPDSEQIMQEFGIKCRWTANDWRMDWIKYQTSLKTQQAA